MHRGGRAGADVLYIGLFNAFREVLTAILRVWAEATWHDAEDAVANLFLTLYLRALGGRFTTAPRDWEAYLARSALNQYRRDKGRARWVAPILGGRRTRIPTSSSTLAPTAGLGQTPKRQGAKRSSACSTGQRAP